MIYLIIILLFILLFIIDVLGYMKCSNYNPDIFCFKWRLIPFIWMFLFKYEKTYTIEEIKTLLFHYKEKYMWYRNIQITRKELNLFIEENL